MDASTRQQTLKEEEALRRLARELDQRYAFGPAFFLGQLAALARDRCPDPAEKLPCVQLHLGDGDVLDVCHVIGLGPAWLALAVYDGDASSRPRPMRTELVPYQAIVRVTIRPERREGASIGFERDHVPAIIGASEGNGTASEDVLRAIAAPAMATKTRGNPSLPGGRS
ncbi:MAG: hypothetical protein U0166_00880 [Acidobacteriota bacterium]